MQHGLGGETLSTIATDRHLKEDEMCCILNGNITDFTCK